MFGHSISAALCAALALSAQASPSTYRSVKDAQKPMSLLNKQSWTYFNGTSRHGKPYHVGYENSSPLPLNAYLVGMGKGNDDPTKGYDVDVDWPTSTDDSWVGTGPGFCDDYGIESYANVEDNGVVYQYTLYIWDTGCRQYWFRDCEGDEYKLFTYRRGTHSLNFNSGCPTIEHIYAEGTGCGSCVRN